MKELCSLFVGQAGIQIANAVWEMLCLEHGVNRDGTIPYDPTAFERNELNTVFQQLLPHDRYVPRAVLADLEPSVIGRFLNHTLSRFSHSDLINKMRYCG